jgi:D-aminoacyl-tRNA deacylase
MQRPLHAGEETPTEKSIKPKPLRAQPLLEPIRSRWRGILVKEIVGVRFVLTHALGLCAMRAVIQRVSQASVTIDGKIVGEIGIGLLILLGIEDADNDEDIDWLATKLAKLRIFSDAKGKMNASITEVSGRALVVSQFTLHAATKKGNRPSFIRAARPEVAIPLYEKFLSRLEQELGQPVERGVFGADMKVALLNDGPVTICMDTKARE